MINSFQIHQANLITQVFALIAVSYILRRGLKPLHMPAVVAELLTGILLGPSCFGLLFSSQQQWLFPSTGNNGLSGLVQMGSLLLLIMTGLEIERDKIHGFKVIALSLGGIIIPFFLGVFTAPFLITTSAHDTVLFNLFIGTAMSISAVSVMAKTFVDINMVQSRIAQIALPAAMVDDTIGWVIMSLITSMTVSKGLNLSDFFQTCGTILLFIALILYFGPKITAYIFRFFSPSLAILMILCTMMATVADLLKIEPILGAFLTAMVLPSEVKNTVKVTLNKIVSAIFAPIFFASAGLKVDLVGSLESLEALKLTVLVLLIACAGKISGVYFSSRIMNLPHSESLAMAWAMNARGSQEIILASIGFSLKIIPSSIYTSIIIMSVMTNLIAAPMLKQSLAKKFYPSRETVMENVKKISDDLTVAGQVSLEQLKQAAQEGFKSVLNLRAPEEKGFLYNEQQLAEAVGLCYVNIPVRLEEINNELATEILKQIDKLPKPVLMHCASEMRASAMALMSVATRQGLTPQQAFEKASEIGFARSAPLQLKQFFEHYVSNYWKSS